MKHQIRLDPCITPAILQQVMQHKPLPELLAKVGLMAHAKDGVPTVEALEPENVLEFDRKHPKQFWVNKSAIDLEFAWHIIHAIAADLIDCTFIAKKLKE